MSEKGVFAKRLQYLFDNKTRADGTKYTPNDVQALTNNAITASYIWRLLSGKARNPSYQVIEELSYFFDIEPNFFFRGYYDTPDDDDNDELTIHMRGGNNLSDLDTEAQNAINNMIRYLRKVQQGHE